MKEKISKLESTHTAVEKCQEALTKTIDALQDERNKLRAELTQLTKDVKKSRKTWKHLPEDRVQLDEDVKKLETQKELVRQKIKNYNVKYEEARRMVLVLIQMVKSLLLEFAKDYRAKQGLALEWIVDNVPTLFSDFPDLQLSENYMEE